MIANFGVHPMPTGPAAAPALRTVTVRSIVCLLSRVAILTSIFEGQCSPIPRHVASACAPSGSVEVFDKSDGDASIRPPSTGDDEAGSSIECPSHSVERRPRSPEDRLHILSAQGISNAPPACKLYCPPASAPFPVIATAAAFTEGDASRSVSPMPGMEA